MMTTKPSTQMFQAEHSTEVIRHPFTQHGLPHYAVSDHMHIVHDHPDFAIDTG